MPKIVIVLTVVTGLDPVSRILSENYEAAVARFNDIAYSEIENSLKVAFNVVSNNWQEIETRLTAHGLLFAPTQLTQPRQAQPVVIE